MAAFLIATSFASGDNIQKLWNMYNSFSRKDLPKEKAEILDRIIEASIAQRDPRNFYYALVHAYDDKVQMNWKDRDEADSLLEKRVLEFNHPVVTYLWMNEHKHASNEQIRAFIKENSRAMIYSNTHLVFSYSSSKLESIIGTFKNDYEMILWHAYKKGVIDISELKAHWAGQYPAIGYLSYIEARESQDKKKALTELVTRYHGHAVSVFPEAELLRLEYDSLDDNDVSNASKYADLYSRCEAFEKSRKAFKGEEKRLAKKETRVKDMIDEMKKVEAQCSYAGDSLLVRMKNCKGLKVNLYRAVGRKAEGKPIRSFSVDNADGSPYIWHEKKIALNDIPDGQYLAKYSKSWLDKKTCYFNLFSLAVATRTDNDGYKVYVTDAFSGKPVENGTLSIYDKEDEKLLYEAPMALHGFTRLDDKASKLIDDLSRYAVLEFQCIDDGGLNRRSDKQYLNFDKCESRAELMWKSCHVLMGKPLYKPGETLDYKAIVYRRGSESCILPGEKVKVSLFDPESKLVEEAELVTDEFGAVTGSFVLPKDRRNGSFALVVKQGSATLGRETVGIDEYELPSFEISFDDSNNKVWIAGEKVEITGSVKSYSGHSLNGVQASAYVYPKYKRGEGKRVDCQLDEDGSFSISFYASADIANVEFRLVDATGETLSEYTSVFVKTSDEKLYFSIEVMNKVAGSLSYTTRDLGFSDDQYGYIVREDAAKIVFSISHHRGGGKKGFPVDFVLTDADGNELTKGTAYTEQEYVLDLSPYKVNDFIISTGEKPNRHDAWSGDYSSVRIVRLERDAKVLDASVSGLFVEGESEVPAGGDISMLIGSGNGPVWAVASLYGYDKELLRMDMVKLEGVKGKEGSLVDVNMKYLDSYPDKVAMHLFYFKDCKEHSYVQTFSRKKAKEEVDVQFSSFTDKTQPGSLCEYTLRTSAVADVAVTVYDKSMDIYGLDFGWTRGPVLSTKTPEIPYVRIGYLMPYDDVVVGYGYSNKPSLFNRVRGAVTRAVDSFNSSDEAVFEESATVSKMSAGYRGTDKAMPVRADFADALCFLPSLRPDADGKVSFDFKASDKLSTFVVRAFAHDKKMHSAVASHELVVSIPVKVSMLEPRFLYVGDMCNIVVNASADGKSSASGDLYLYVYPGKDHEHLEPLSVYKEHVEIETGKSASVTVPVKPSKVGEIGLKAVFVGDNYSDGMFVTVPVKAPVQTLTESHSKVVLSGMDQNAAEKELRSRFVNVSGKDAVVKVVSILDMLKEAVPEEYEPKGEDVISLTSAYLVRKLAAKLVPTKDEDDEALLEKIMLCKKSNGGFSWFPGMASSEVITARVLERFARLRENGVEIPDMTESVKYLDASHFDGDRPYWRGRIMDGSYMYVRSMYPEVSFIKPSGTEDKERFAEFRKFAKHYLSPDAIGDYHARGDIYLKVLRLSVLSNLSASDDAMQLAKAWGAGLFASYKVSSSLKTEVRSVLEYAVKHDDGGIYYPNAVMPFRGMLEDEAYMHAMICRLLTKVAPESEVADGIRIWLMLQKETQEWKASPAFVETIAAVLEGPESVLSTKVLALSAEYSKPLTEIKAAGNGYTISKTYLKLGADGKQHELKGGEPIAAGDRIVARYNIWSAENRSFVKITAPREAAFSPVEQFSGYYRGGYREVRADRTNYYFDVYPEEKTTIEEEFFVTRRGVFMAPVITVESFYAPHYRANDKFFGKIVAD